MADRGLVPQETANYVPSVLAASRLLFANGKQFTEAQALPRTSEGLKRMAPTGNQ